MIFIALLGCQPQNPKTSQAEPPKKEVTTAETSLKAQKPTPSTQLLYIQSSTANLRSEASTQSTVLIGLPIGTKGEVRKTEGEWIYIQAGEHTGWVHTSLLTEKQPTLEDALSQYETANRSDKRKWIERAAALAPQNKEVIAMLIEELDYQGDHDAKRKAELGLRSLKTMDPIYFSNKSFQDGAPEDYLMLYPSTLSCLEEVKAIALRGAEPPSEEMQKKWRSWYREVPKEEYWSVFAAELF